jgi:hypothetical protein
MTSNGSILRVMRWGYLRVLYPAYRYLHGTHDIGVLVEKPDELLQTPQAALAHADDAPEATGRYILPNIRKYSRSMHANLKVYTRTRIAGTARKTHRTKFVLFVVIGGLYWSENLSFILQHYSRNFTYFPLLVIT